MLNFEQILSELVYKLLADIIVHVTNIIDLRNFVGQKQLRQVVAPGLVKPVICQVGLGVVSINGVPLERRWGEVRRY